MLVLQHVRELVRERDADRRRQRLAPDVDALLRRDVDRQRPLVGEIALRLGEVDLTAHQAERAQRRGTLFELLAALLVEVGGPLAGDVAVLLRVEELDVHGMLELEIASAFDPRRRSRTPWDPTRRGGRRQRRR